MKSPKEIEEIQRNLDIDLGLEIEGEIEDLLIKDLDPDSSDFVLYTFPSETSERVIEHVVASLRKTGWCVERRYTGVDRELHISRGE